MSNNYRYRNQIGRGCMSNQTQTQTTPVCLPEFNANQYKAPCGSLPLDNFRGGGAHCSKPVPDCLGNTINQIGSFGSDLSEMSFDNRYSVGITASGGGKKVKKVMKRKAPKQKQHAGDGYYPDFERGNIAGQPVISGYNNVK